MVHMLIFYKLCTRKLVSTSASYVKQCFQSCKHSSQSCRPFPPILAATFARKFQGRAESGTIDDSCALDEKRTEEEGGAVSQVAGKVGLSKAVLFLTSFLRPSNLLACRARPQQCWTDRREGRVPSTPATRFS